MPSSQEETWTKSLEGKAKAGRSLEGVTALRLSKVTNRAGRDEGRMSVRSSNNARWLIFLLGSSSSHGSDLVLE